MKLSDVLKKLGLNLDDDIELNEDEKNETEEKNKDKGKEKDKDKKEEGTKGKEDNKDKEDDNGENSDNPDDKHEKLNNNIDKKDMKTEEVNKVKIEFNDKTGLFKTDGIEDAELKSVLEQANNYTITTRNNVAIDQAFNEKLGTLKLRKGITVDLVKKVIDLSQVKVDGDKVSGIDEAFENLQKEQSGLFVSRSQTESSPLLDGFNPANDGVNDNKSSLDSALAGLAASLSGNN